VPAFYLLGARTVLLILLLYRPTATWPGFAIVLFGIPVYALVRSRKARAGVPGAGVETAL
jgi:APA family basic amino acid/polyamine antiporter